MEILVPFIAHIYLSLPHFGSPGDAVSGKYLFPPEGHELLSELQQRRFNGSDGGVSWSPMDDELLAQPQVMKLLDSLREQYTRYQEVCRQRSKRTQLEEIQQKVMQVGTKLYLVSFLSI